MRALRQRCVREDVCGRGGGGGGCSAERTGWEGERESTDCLQSDIRAFRIAGGWKMTVLEAELWVEIVTEGGRS